MEEIKHSRMKSDEKLANAVVVTPETKKPKVKITKRLLSAYNLFLKYNSVIQASFDTLDDIPTSSFGLEDVDIGASPWLMMAPNEEFAAYKKVIR
jgi:hypothetical protein